MIYIRVDMNEQIATGHMMRCIAVADAAKSLGEPVTFLLADSQAAGLLRERGYGYIILHSKWDNMEAELPALILILQQKKIRRLLVDSYQVTEKYLEAIREYAQIYYMDDLDVFHYPVQGIISYEIYSQHSHYAEKYRGCSLYLGCKYAPLKKEFLDCGEKEIAEKAESLILLSGGMDCCGFLEKMLERLERERYREINVICGYYNKDYGVLCEKYRQEENVKFYKHVADIDVYMKKADMAISAGGVTIYELCACGTPTISYALSDNQLGTVKKFAEDGIIDYAGDARTEPVEDIIYKYLEIYQDSRELRWERSRKMQQLVDGKGALRIARILMEKER